MEWPYDRIRDKSGRTALIQICDEKQILLFHAVIENPDVPKLGVNIRSDGMKLFGDFGILASNLIELGALAGQADERFAASYNRPIVALAKVVEFYLQRTLKKGPERASQWQDDLNPLQMTYAANDAHCSLMVYKKLIAVASETNRALSPDVYTRDLAKELASLSKAECALSER
ncbi:ribonuclease H-like protein [Artomyces pyxidatus]|uniref:Ribonuclease H-like protein n=1 Tax=Artomyces pyxidatus TaxID=48021 RepID=A0ACB8T6V4_9AGAM|nr:ribonuclease H-like protein [Artomyces pyxidatus]